MVAKLLAPGGIPYGKKDGQCCHPSCLASIDFSVHDKPPAGWATVVMTRTFEPRRKKRMAAPPQDATITMLLCPQHTVSFTLRQPPLLGGVKHMLRVLLVTPLNEGHIETNLKYLHAALADCYERGEAPLHPVGPTPAPFAAIEAYAVWAKEAAKVIVCTDLGITPQMQDQIEKANDNGQIIEMRKLLGWTKIESMRHT